MRRTPRAAIGLAVLPLMPGGMVEPAHEGEHEYGFVDVVDAEFEPAEVVIPSGARVLWKHEGAAPHDIYADDGSFSSHPACSTPAGQCMTPGETYEHEFAEPGRYPYHCRIHGGPGGAGMSGVVVVQAAEDDPAEEPPAADEPPGEQPPADDAAGDAPAESGDAAGAAALPRSGAAAPLAWGLWAAATGWLLRARRS